MIPPPLKLERQTEQNQMRLPISALVTILPFYLEAVVAQGAQGTGKTTRYWDCW